MQICTPRPSTRSGCVISVEKFALRLRKHPRLAHALIPASARIFRRCPDRIGPSFSNVRHRLSTPPAHATIKIQNAIAERSSVPFLVFGNDRTPSSSPDGAARHRVDAGIAVVEFGPACPCREPSWPCELSHISGLRQKRRHACGNDHAAIRLRSTTASRPSGKYRKPSACPQAPFPAAQFDGALNFSGRQRNQRRQQQGGEDVRCVSCLFLQLSLLVSFHSWEAIAPLIFQLLELRFACSNKFAA